MFIHLKTLTKGVFIMKKVQSIKFGEFMTGEYAVKQEAQKKARNKKIKHTAQKVTKAGAIGLGFTLIGSPVGAVMGATRAFAESNAVATTAQAVPVNASEWMGQKTLETIAHALDPVIDLLVALSFPIASVIVVGACFYFMFGNPEKAWKGIQNAGLGYVLIQVSPLLLSVLKEIGNAV